MVNMDNEACLSVLDLPQLHNKPDAATLLRTLSQLAIVPSSFGAYHSSASLKVDESGVTSYLTRFVGSPLAWILSDVEKEQIWEAASKRLSERSGRMAMASISRTFTICDYAVLKDGKAPRYIPIRLNEPSLTEDNVGHKTWTGSFLLAKRLPYTMVKYFPTLLSSSIARRSPSPSINASKSSPPLDAHSDHLHYEALKILTPPPSPPTSSAVPYETSPVSPANRITKPVKVLELGAGTGLTGMAAASLFSDVAVHLTDLPSIIPNLIANVETNSFLFARPPTIAALDWSRLPSNVALHKQYDCILAADSLYDPKHPGWLTNAMFMFLKRQKEARIIVELPFRDMDLPYHDLLRQQMEAKGFVLVDEGRESGYDDWEGAWSEKKVVLCWWSVWRWADSELKKMAEDDERIGGNEVETSDVSEGSWQGVPQHLQQSREIPIPKTPSAEATTKGECSSANQGHGGLMRITGAADSVVEEGTLS